MCNEIIKPKLFVILGPTAVGKSSLAIKLAENNDASILNADSLQVYKYLDIGTAKPTAEDRAKVPHYMLDILDPDQEFNAAMYRNLAVPVIDKLTENNNKIILVGGTFLYVKVLLSGLISNSEFNPDIRNKIENIKNSKGLAFLYRVLSKIDKDSYEKINQNDYIRIQRALEVYFSTGIRISELHKKHNFKTNNYEICKIGLNTDKGNMHTRINNRVDSMLKHGFIDEVINLRSMGYDTTIKSMQSIGYKELNNYLSGNIDLETAINLIKQNTRRYAKRQLTWLRKEKDVNWYSNLKDFSLIEDSFHRFFGN